MRLLIVLTLGVLMSACPSEGVPSPDDCASSDESEVTGLAIGHATLNAVFEDYTPDDEVKLVIGTQGGAMIPLRIRVETTDGSCLETSMNVWQDDELLAEEIYPLRLYPQSDGARVSNTHYIILNRQPSVGETVELEVSVGDGLATSNLTILP